MDLSIGYSRFWSVARRALLVLGALVVTLAVSLWGAVYVIQGPPLLQGATDIRFREISVDWAHRADLNGDLPFAAFAAIDVDGDGTDEVFAGGGSNQVDTILRFEDGAFRSMNVQGFMKPRDEATYGAASIDATGDGRADLFVAREHGVSFYVNEGGGRFRGDVITTRLASNTSPLSIALGDINGDNRVDLYVSGYLKSELVKGETNFNQPYGGYSQLLLNRGDNTWQDITKSAGLWRQHNTFTAAFVDLDNDGDSDLVVAQDVGVVETYLNNGDLTFAPLKNPSVFSYPMGLGVGDYDGDGRMDLYFSNVGRTLPTFMVRGDLRDDQPFNPHHMLFRNSATLSFTDTAAVTGVDRLGFGWGAVIQDMTLDGRPDLIVAQNYARLPGVRFLPLYNGSIMQQAVDGSFSPIEEASGAVNPSFGLTPIVSDFNRDGAPDLFWGNLNGRPRAYFNLGAARHWLSVRLANEPRSIGAIVTLTLADGRVLTDQFITSEGLGSDQTHELMFGLGDGDVASLRVVFQDGRVLTRDNVARDQVLDLARGMP